MVKWELNYFLCLSQEMIDLMLNACEKYRRPSLFTVFDFSRVIEWQKIQISREIKENLKSEFCNLWIFTPSE